MMLTPNGRFELNTKVRSDPIPLTHAVIIHFTFFLISFSPNV